MSQASDLLLTRLGTSLGADRLGEFVTPFGTFASAAPRTPEEVAQVLISAGEVGARVLPAGRGTKLSCNLPPERVDLVLTTHALDAVIAYEPGDGTVTTQAGVPWRSLSETVSAGGHHITPWIARPEQATVGGIVGAGQSGIDRLRFGPLRHHVLGMSVVLADGRIVRCGGRLVKNVTGFELQRMMTGSRGSLGVIVEVSMRLFPASECLLVCTSPELDPAGAFAMLDALDAKLWRPLCLCAELHGDRATVHAVVSGNEATVASERKVLRRVLGSAATVTEGEAAVPAIERLADLETPAAPHLVLGGRPSSIPAAAEYLLGEPDVTALVQPRLGLITLTVADAARAIALRDRAKALPLSLRSHGVSIPPLGMSAGAGVWMNRLRASQDPGGVFAR